jgi:hypothetical protein
MGIPPINLVQATIWVENGREASVLVDVQRMVLFDARGRRIVAVPVRASGASAAC